jgi:hypothetical protein
MGVAFGGERTAALIARSPVLHSPQLQAPRAQATAPPAGRVAGGAPRKSVSSPGSLRKEPRVSGARRGESTTGPSRPFSFLTARIGASRTGVPGERSQESRVDGWVDFVAGGDRQRGAISSGAGRETEGSPRDRSGRGLPGTRAGGRAPCARCVSRNNSGSRRWRSCSICAWGAIEFHEQGGERGAGRYRRLAGSPLSVSRRRPYASP